MLVSQTSYKQSEEFPCEQQKCWLLPQMTVILWILYSILTQVETTTKKIPSFKLQFKDGKYFKDQSFSQSSKVTCFPFDSNDSYYVPFIYASLI